MAFSSMSISPWAATRAGELAFFDLNLLGLAEVIG
jgi:hypothetical protein